MLKSSIRASQKLARAAVLCIFSGAGVSTLAFAQAAHFAASEPASASTVHDVPTASSDYRPITSEERFKWFAHSTVGTTSLVGGIFSSALGTALDSPSEYGPHWDGFGKRYGMRLTGISTGNAIEAGLGAAWGEDPRYFPVVERPFKSRVKNIVDLTFRAYRSDGERHLAYARYAATFGNNAISNSWRAPSESDWQHALLRTAEGFGGRALSNTFSEFFPQAIRKLRHKPESQ
ncbi:MAG: hypothetical protein JST28_21875 [Acidobacteria bacterium]|nr:hypothetical protein [Acidobacteriota bacterium]